VPPLPHRTGPVPGGAKLLGQRGDTRGGSRDKTEPMKRYTFIEEVVRIQLTQESISLSRKSKKGGFYSGRNCFGGSRRSMTDQKKSQKERQRTGKRTVIRTKDNYSERLHMVVFVSWEKKWGWKQTKEPWRENCPITEERSPKELVVDFILVTGRRCNGGNVKRCGERVREERTSVPTSRRRDIKREKKGDLPHPLEKSLRDPSLFRRKTMEPNKKNFGQNLQESRPTSAPSGPVDPKMAEDHYGAAAEGLFRLWKITIVV